MMKRNFEITEGDENLILSLKRDKDGVVFRVGDTVGLTFHIEEGVADGNTILRFMTETDRTHNHPLLQNAPVYPVGTIVTECGIIELGNAGHIDRESENYKIMNTPLNLTVRDIIKLTNHKYGKKLVKVARKIVIDEVKQS